MQPAWEVVAILSWLNADRGDQGGSCGAVLEAYQPLVAVQAGAPIGVLELYLPSAPIASDIARG